MWSYEVRSVIETLRMALFRVNALGMYAVAQRAVTRALARRDRDEQLARSFRARAGLALYDARGWLWPTDISEVM